MFSLPTAAVQRRIRALKNRLGNLPEKEFKEAFEAGFAFFTFLSWVDVSQDEKTCGKPC